MAKTSQFQVGTATLNVGPAQAHTDVTLDLVGANPNTNVTFTVSLPGAGDMVVPMKTDDNGEAVVTVVPSSAGTMTVSVSSAVPDISVLDPTSIDVS